MPRKLKPYKVDEVLNPKTGIKVDIMLDRNDKVFFGMVGPTRIEAPTAEECEKAVRKALRDYTGLEWQSFIIVDSEGGESHWRTSGHETRNANVSLRFHRLYGAKTVDGTWVQKPFEEDAPGGSYHFDAEHYMRRWWRGDDESTIPYTDEAWATLNTMRDRIEGIAEFLKELIGRKDFAALLNNPKSDLLLGSGQKRGKKKRKKKAS
jgi:hypothetical protein